MKNLNVSIEKIFVNKVKSFEEYKSLKNQK